MGFAPYLIFARQSSAFTRSESLAAERSTSTVRLYLLYLTLPNTRDAVVITFQVLHTEPSLQYPSSQHIPHSYALLTDAAAVTRPHATLSLLLISTRNFYETARASRNGQPPLCNSSTVLATTNTSHHSTQTIRRRRRRVAIISSFPSKDCSALEHTPHQALGTLLNTSASHGGTRQQNVHILDHI